VAFDVCKVDDRRTEAQCSVAAPGDPVSGLVAPLHYQCQLIHGATVSTLLVTTNIAQQEGSRLRLKKKYLLKLCSTEIRY